MGICKSSGTSEETKFMESFIKLFAVVQKMKSDRGCFFIYRENRKVCEENIENEYNSPIFHTDTRAVDLTKQTLKNLIIANLQNKSGITERVNRPLRVMRFTIHTGF